MPERQAFIDRVKGVERECDVVTAAAAYFGRGVTASEVAMPGKTTIRDLVVVTHRVEPTYLIRMWAEFELALRSYSFTKTGSESIRSRDLVNWTSGIRQGRMISEIVRDRVHAIREYRNSLVHGTPVGSMPISEARKSLNTLLGCLPSQW